MRNQRFNSADPESLLDLEEIILAAYDRQDRAIARQFICRIMPDIALCNPRETREGAGAVGTNHAPEETDRAHS